MATWQQQLDDDGWLVFVGAKKSPLQPIVSLPSNWQQITAITITPTTMIATISSKTTMTTLMLEYPQTVRNNRATVAASNSDCHFVAGIVQGGQWQWRRRRRRRTNRQQEEQIARRGGRGSEGRRWQSR
jgi:hypothetical protein